MRVVGEANLLKRGAGAPRRTYSAPVCRGGSNVRTFETIAMEASECKIFAYRCSAVLAGDNVIDLKRESVLRMWDSAVFTAISCSFSNLPKQLLVH
jgi:hypothetical protein